MKVQADKHRRDIIMEEGQWCYVRLQPHRQRSVSGQKFTKLSKRFYGPFQILKRVGSVAYKLALPDYSKIHPIFYVSVLKWCPNPEDVTVLQLPSTSVDNQPLVTPLAILNVKRIRKDQSWTSQVLVQWDGLPLEETSWVDINSFQQDYPQFHLEDKVLFHTGGSDTIKDKEEKEIQSTRIKSVPRKLVDYNTTAN
ncbi:uncharacterized protein [Henckelia pumila]|uniref:uncharacterized protein n=1 Tax=Henckelia pumila TaxID=405737 RepID=UPI003C6E23CF